MANRWHTCKMEPRVYDVQITNDYTIKFITFYHHYECGVDDTPYLLNYYVLNPNHYTSTGLKTYIPIIVERVAQLCVKEGINENLTFNSKINPFSDEETIELKKLILERIKEILLNKDE